MKMFYVIVYFHSFNGKIIYTSTQPNRINSNVKHLYRLVKERDLSTSKERNDEMSM